MRICGKCGEKAYRRVCGIKFSMRNSENVKKDIFDIVKAVLISTLFALAFVLVFALIIRWANVDDSAIMPVNIVIKLVSIVIGVAIGFKNPQNGILKGAATGLFFMLLTLLIFASLNGFKDVGFNWVDLISLPIAGGIAGIITVNLKHAK